MRDVREFHVENRERRPVVARPAKPLTNDKPKAAELTR
jgi:hypothetical protein